MSHASAPAAATPRFFRHALASGGEGPEMAAIPAGAFWMGAAPGDPEAASSERPRMLVRFREAFALGRAPVTFADYDRFVAATGAAAPSDSGFGRGARPVINVCWRDAQAYCAWLSEETGVAHQLPSEAAWEYACRAGAETRFAWGDDLTTAEANFDPACEADPIGLRDATTPVRAFEPNAWGLYDMHGNVSEWCADGWAPTHAGADQDGAARPYDPADPAATVVVRGGGWSTKKRFLRSSERYHYAPTAGFEMIGFRVFHANADILSPVK